MALPRRPCRVSAVPDPPLIAPAGPPATLRFVSFLAPKLLGFYAFLAERVARSLGCRVEVVVGTSYDELDSADVGVVGIGGSGATNVLFFWLPTGGGSTTPPCSCT